MSFSPDGALLAIGTEDGRVMLYDTQFFQKICDIRMPPSEPAAGRNSVFSLLWTPDGSRLITTSDRLIRILETDQHIARERRADEWNERLAMAREAHASAEFPLGNPPDSIEAGAWRVAQIEKWAVDLTLETTARSP